MIDFSKNLVVFPFEGMQEALRDIVSGTIAGSAGIIVGHPLDCIKVRLQRSGSSIASAIQLMVREGGMKSFFRGLSSPVIANAPINAIVFAVEGASMRYFSSTRPEWSSPFTHAVSGSTAGLSQVLIACPSELVKVQMQAGKTFSSTFECFRYITREHGFGALYRGFGLTLARDTISWGVYFGAYDYMKTLATRREYSNFDRQGGGPHNRQQLLLQQQQQQQQVSLPVTTLMVCGGCAGVASWVIMHPVDVLKSIQQSAPLDSPAQERSVVALWNSYMSQFGPRFLLRGLLTTIVRAFPTSAVTFPVFEFCIDFYNGRHVDGGRDEVAAGHR